MLVALLVHPLAPGVFVGTVALGATVLVGGGWLATRALGGPGGHLNFLPPFYSRMAAWCGGRQHLNKCQSGNHVTARRHETRQDEPARWTALAARLGDHDEDTRPAESVGHAQDGQPATYPPLTVVKPQPDLPPPATKAPQAHRVSEP